MNPHMKEYLDGVEGKLAEVQGAINELSDYTDWEREEEFREITRDYLWKAADAFSRMKYRLLHIERKEKK